MPVFHVKAPHACLQMRLMNPPNTTWQQILAQARVNPLFLKDPVSITHSAPPCTAASVSGCTSQVVMKSIQNVLQSNVSVCTSLGQPFVTQFNLIFADMLLVSCLQT
jgi:exportin-1